MDDSLANIKLSDEFIEIPSYMFYYSANLKNIYLPKTLETIWWEAFYECTNLEAVYYYGTIETWKSN